MKIKQLVGALIWSLTWIFLSSSVALAGDGGDLPSPVLPITVALVLIALGVGIGAFKDPYSEKTSDKVRKIIGIIVSTAGFYLFVGLFFIVPVPPQAEESGIQWYHDCDEASAVAIREGKPMFIDFTANWCTACQNLAAACFTNKEVIDEAKGFVAVKVDLSGVDDYSEHKCASKFELPGLPRVFFHDPQGNLLPDLTIAEEVEPEVFLERMKASRAGVAPKGESDSSVSEFERTMSEDGLFWALLLVFLAGIGASLTPCVYPLIPVTVGIFGASKSASRLDSFLRSLTYVAGIAITYSTLGVIAAEVGGMFGAAMQSPWVTGTFAVLFVLMGLFSVGVFEFKVPGFLQNKLSSVGGAGYMGALAMGLVAGVIAAPCVGPILGGVLLFIAKTQNHMLGFFVMFTFALGMGLLFLLLGTFSNLVQKLPRSGSWMEAVKVIFAILFFTIALYYLQLAVGFLEKPVELLWRIA